MNNNYIANLFFTVIVIFYGSSTLNAQDNKTDITTSIGVSSPILDSGIGYFAGLNFARPIKSHLALEGQLSYLYTDVTGTFLGGATKTLSSTNALVGARLYITAPEKKVRPFLNALLGANYLIEKREGRDDESGFNLGITLGAFLEIQDFIVGLSFEGEQSVILKVGYTFY